MGIYSVRKRRREQAAREAAGEILWSEEFPREARVRIKMIWTLIENAAEDSGTPSNDIARYISMSLQAAAGRTTSLLEPNEFVADYPLEDRLDILELMHNYLRDRPVRNWSPGRFAEALNSVLLSHRVAFKMIEGEILPYRNDPVYIATVEPTVRLLIDKRFDGAQLAYLDALKELQAGEAGDAITDAGTALQETLQALGCKGNALGPLIKDAKARGLLAGHDSARLGKAVVDALEWASADRSEMGDGHKYSAATVADAWLTVQVVGALILRLADDTLRQPKV